MSNEKKCFYCDGHGEVAPHILDDQPCPVCNGTGKKPVPVSVETSKPADLPRKWHKVHISFDTELPVGMDAEAVYAKLDFGMPNAVVNIAVVDKVAHISEVERVTKQWDALTYKSSQHTNCAVCGEDKHTPLRLDEPDGYVCLTCTLKLLEETQSDRDEYEKQLEAAESKLSQLQCPHPHLDGIDKTPEGPDKVWKCQMCSGLLKFRDSGNGRSKAIPWEEVEKAELSNEKKAREIGLLIRKYMRHEIDGISGEEILAILNGGQS